MASPATNAANAQLSTGPRTDQGKERVRMNALKHGFYSETALLPYEDAAAFASLGEKLTRSFLPRGEEEETLIRTIHHAQWRLDRVLALERGLYAVAIQENLEPIQTLFPGLDAATHIDLARASAYRANTRNFDQFQRQEARLRRIVDRAYTAYFDLKFPAEPIDSSHDEAALKSALDAIRDFAPRAAAMLAAGPSATAVGFVPRGSAQLPPTPSGMPRFTGPLADIKRKQWLRRHSNQAA